MAIPDAAGEDIVVPLDGAETYSPQISVIVLNWNGERLLGDCLGSLRRQTYPDFETLLVDNGSTDDSVALVRREYPEVRVLSLGGNYGFCAGNNRGVIASRGKYVFFLNNDTECEPMMLEELYRAIQNDPPEVGSWATKMLRWDQRHVVDNRGCGYSAFGTGYQIGSGELDDPTVATDQLVFGVSGGAGCYRKSVLDDIGTFDEDFFFNNEDVDLSFRSQLAGYHSHFVPRAIVYHHGSATSRAASDASVYYINRNKEWVFLKNMPSQLMWKYLPLHLCYSLGWVIYWAMMGRARPVLRAKIDVWRGGRAMLVKRKHIQSRRRVDPAYIDQIIDWRRALRFWRSKSLASLCTFWRAKRTSPTS